MNQESRRWCMIITSFVVLLLAGIGGVQHLGAQEVELEQHCSDAERFLVQDQGMMAITEPDTILDWRTSQRVPGCRVTAAGLTSMDLAAQAADFYRQLRAAGWIRTPEPSDAPDEGSLRFRMNESDCLFNFYSAGHLGTLADLSVSSDVVPDPGEIRYNVLLLCQPAMEATSARQQTSQF